MSGALFDLVASQLELDQRIAPVVKMEDRIRLQTIAVMVVRQPSAERLRIDPKITDTKTFKDKAEASVPRQRPVINIPP